MRLSLSNVALTFLIAVAPAITAFLISPSLQLRPRQSYKYLIDPETARSTKSRLSMGVHVVDYSANPYDVLNLSPAAGKKEIKRAYRKLALKYHPDVVTNQDTSPSDKKEASQFFAKINWAYAQLSGRDGDSSFSASATSTSTTSTTGTTTSTSTSSSSSYSHTTTPHGPSSTRSSSYFYTYDPDQNIWADTMPKNYPDGEYQTYKAGGHDFEKDLQDFYEEFQQVNNGGYYSYSENEDDTTPLPIMEDDQFQDLLNTGSVERVGMEMDTMELVVQQLETNWNRLGDELLGMRRAQSSSCDSKRIMNLRKQVAEAEEKTKVVEANLNKARHRLMALQTRFYELLVTNENDVEHGSSSHSGATSSPYWETSSSKTKPTSRTARNGAEDPWKYDEYGFTYRGTGGSSERQASPSSPPHESASTSSKKDSTASNDVHTRGSTSSQSTSFSGTSSSSRKTSSQDSTASSKEDTTWKHDAFGSVYVGRDTRSTATGATSSSSGGTSSSKDRTTASPPRQDDTWTHDAFGSVFKGRSSSSQQQASSSHTPPKSSPAGGTSSKDRTASSSSFNEEHTFFVVNGENDMYYAREQSSSSPSRTSPSSGHSGTTSSPSSASDAGKHNGFGYDTQLHGPTFVVSEENAVDARAQSSCNASWKPPPQSGTTSSARGTSTKDGAAPSASNKEGAAKHKGFGSDTGSTASSSQQQSSSTSTSPPPRQESPVTPPPRPQTSIPRPQSSTKTTTTGRASSNAGTTFSSSAWKDQGYGNIGRGPGSSRRAHGIDTRSTSSSSERQSTSSSTPPPTRQESSSKSGTIKNGSTAPPSIAWKYEGYGNIGRGPGSSRRARGLDTRSTATIDQHQSTSSSTPPSARQESSSTSGTISNTSTAYSSAPSELDQAHNAGCDDFEQKISDLHDELLEVNANFFLNGEEEDAQLKILLKTGSVDQVGTEIDDMELVVQQLDSERRNLGTELRQANRKSDSTKFYLEKKDLDKTVAELEVRKKVLDTDLKKARRRLLALQTRHKQLGGLNGSSSSSRSTSSSFSGASLSEEDAWKHERFANIGRGPGSSRRARGRDTQSTDSFSQQQPSSSSTRPPPRQESSSTRATSSSGSTATSSSASGEEDAWKHEGFGNIGRGPSSSRRARGRDTLRQEYSSMKGTSGSGSTVSSSSSASSEEDAWKHEGFGFWGRIRGSVRRSQN